MAFVKVKDIKHKEAIINTDLICRISKNKNTYTFFLSSGNVGSSYYDFSDKEIQKVFKVIGVSLD